eukprot:6269041-Amphidinium_carterae.2
MKVMGDDEELHFWRQIWSERKVPMEYDIHRLGTSFYDLKSKAWAALKKDQYRMFEASVLPCYPLSAEHRSWRKGHHYDPPEVLHSSNLVGNMALCARRELAWTTSRKKILSTPGPARKLLRQLEQDFDEATLIAHLSDFYLQTSGSLRDVRGNPVDGGRVEGRQWEQSLHELLEHVTTGAPSVDVLQWRVTATATESEFLEQTAIWMQMIGQIILPMLRDNRTIRYEIDKLGTLFQYLYVIMGTEHMKDISHLGGMGHYGDDGYASQEGVEKIHTTDFGNGLYAEVLMKSADLAVYADFAKDYTTEHKGDVVESILGLNFLEKEGVVHCEHMGITYLEDARETMLRVEWYCFKKGLAWLLAYFAKAPIISAIVAMREACANSDLYVGEDGISLSPVLKRRCMGCGRKKSKRKFKATCFPRLFVGLSDHMRYNCIHDFFTGADELAFESFVNIEDTMTNWWEAKARAFVVYVSESGHRQWPVGGKWDLEIMACALSGAF